MKPEQLLLVDDDLALGELLSEYLRHEGYQVAAVQSGQAALERLQQGESYDLLILDIMMPGMSGLELLQRLRPSIQTPVIMLTGRGEEIDRILGLEMGADDYLPKPCNPRELLARVRAVLRRSQPAVQENSVLCSHGIALDAGRREVLCHGQVLELTSAEFNVLHEFMRHPGQVLSKELLTERVLHRKLTAYDRALDVHVSRLRQKLDQAGIPAAELIKTVRGQGYLWVLESGT
ncbi:response regulator transcription factor [Nitrincola tapanii]|uniref:Response regulator transcription factor n=1 Tax=Nitrincola tapanii TaxID=1708751 RepID=A0A5A9W4J4_9GAMM|nr:response regulator transcription factor [Nitrincola tapanii]KAA0874471.1 response regulator transcription factor [Nitrincola tapanii]